MLDIMRLFGQVPLWAALLILLLFKNGPVRKLLDGLVEVCLDVAKWKVKVAKGRKAAEKA